MKARVKATGEVLRVLDLDLDKVLIKYGNETKSLRIHEVDLIPETVDDYSKVGPNWEQRRYEIVKDLLAGYTSNSSERIMNANVLEQIETSIEIADVLIDKLKGGKK